ncbi:MAG: hypothetical protein ACK4L7_04875 [Flavobacteriales bacterium]
MFRWEPPSLSRPFELWRDGCVVHVAIAEGARLGSNEMKEIIRLVAALDRSGGEPVLVGYAPGAAADEAAQRLLMRVCGKQGRPVAVHCSDGPAREALERLRLLCRPRFAFKVFETRPEAWKWARQRQQLAGWGLLGPSAAGAHAP